MPLTLDASVGGAASNAYLDRTAADAYFDGRAFATAWTGATSPVKEQALVMATSRLDREAFIGVKVATAQRLAWPRRWARTKEGNPSQIRETIPWVDQTVLYYDSTTIPRPVQEATCELALVIVAAAADPFAEDPTLAIKRDKVDVLETEYVEAAMRPLLLGKYPQVLGLIGHLLMSQQQVAVVRG